MFPLTFALVCLCSQRLYVPPDFCTRLSMLTQVVRSSLTFALDSHSISFILTFGLTHRVCPFPLSFVNTLQDWLILQISLARLRVAHMASHWRMTVDAAKFNIFKLYTCNFICKNHYDVIILNFFKFCVVAFESCHPCLKTYDNCFCTLLFSFLL
jgi:hypothetical protein